jgi:DUF177 domain-containing protein
VTSFSLRQVRLRPGEELRDEVEIDVVPFDFGGQRYIAIPERVPAELTLNRTTNGTTFRLRFHVRVHGPCVRCLGEASLDVPVDAREYQANDPQGDEELRSEYVSENELDLSTWARDAVALELPDQILCREDCAGLCPVCGKNLNDEPHAHEQPVADSRWSALEALKDRL